MDHVSTNGLILTIMNRFLLTLVKHELHIFIGCFKKEKSDWEKEMCFKLPK